MNIRFATEQDWVNLETCGCGWINEYREVSLLNKHHQTDCPDKGTASQWGNSRQGRKIDKNLNSLIGANGEIYIIYWYKIT